MAPGEISTCFPLLPFLAFLFLFFLISLKRFMTAKDSVENSNVCAYSSFNAHKGSKGREVRVVKRRPERHKVKLQPKQIGGCCCLRLFTCSAQLKFCAHFCCLLWGAAGGAKSICRHCVRPWPFFMPPRCIFATPFPLDFYCLFSVEAVKLCVCVCECGMGKLQRSKLLLKLFKVIRMCKR